MKIKNLKYIYRDGKMFWYVRKLLIEAWVYSAFYPYKYTFALVSCLYLLAIMHPAVNVAVSAVLTAHGITGLLAWTASEADHGHPVREFFNKVHNKYLRWYDE